MTPEEFVEKFHTEHPDIDRWISVKEDHIALVKLIELFNIRLVFEFGTWRGCTTLLFYTHPDIKEVTTLDIYKKMDVAYFHGSHPLSGKDFYGSFFKGKPIKQIFCDSMKFKPAAQYDMVFIDANHDYEHVKNDTELALGMATKIIAWHDYRNGNPEVDIYLDELMKAGNKILAVYPGSCVMFMEKEKHDT